MIAPYVTLNGTEPKGRTIMKRVSLTDGTWFDIQRATRYQEESRFDGQNYISLSTGSQWNHECLYRTANGTWILHSWSDWQGSGESWDRVDEPRAASWLIANGHDLPPALAGVSSELEV